MRIHRPEHWSPYALTVSAGEVTSRDFFERLRLAVWPPSVSASSGNESARLTQAKLFVEIARRVERPLDPLPNGDPALVCVVLWQCAAAWAIAATPDFVTGGAGSAEARAILERVAGGSEALALVESLLRSDLAAPDGVRSSEAVSVTVTNLSSFTARLIDELERPAREQQKRRNARATRLILGGAVAVLAAFLIARTLRPPDLVPSAVRTQSSFYSTCDAGQCGNALFSTKEELEPWVRYDFGTEKRLHSISLVNRTDCCFERAVPLVVETSNDGRRWKERVRTTEPFMTWSAKLNGRARYVRLRVARTSFLHLSSVVIR
jgi:hypothetical protein